MAYHRKVKCPRHFMLKPGRTGFIMELDPLMKNFDVETCKRFKVSKYKKKRDKRGQYMRNDKDYYQPEMSDAFFIEHVYDPMNHICKMQCRGRCLEGKGNVNTHIIKRLNGKSHTGKDLQPKLVV